MTECERIVKQGILPEKFFSEEIRCGFLVTKERKKLWAIQLDLLLFFDSLCKQHRLEYSLCGGTLLGAIRHNGFIPWDDDLDVAMPRDDYEKFINLSNEIKQPYFLQTPLTDEYYAFAHARLRNANTTCFTELFAFQPMNHGAYIEISPIDNWIASDVKSYNKINELNCENSTFMRMLNPFLDENNKKRVQLWKKKNPIDVYKEINLIAKQYNNQKTEYQMRAVVSFLPIANMLQKKDDYEKKTLHTFENFQFPIPLKFDNLLQKRYGEYMQYPITKDRGQWHKGFIFDGDTPYKEYLKKYKEDKMNIGV